MATHLLLRLQGPLQAWGDTAFDRHRPTRAFPGKSAIAGLLASSLGWTYADHSKLNKLAASIVYGVAQISQGVPLVDFQTVDLGAEQRGERRKGWAPDGVEERGGSAKRGTHLLAKHYWAGADFLVAMRIENPTPTIAEVAQALKYPARPVFLGRKSCPPGVPMYTGKTEAANVFTALKNGLTHIGRAQKETRAWYPPGEGPAGQTTEITDTRNFSSNQFTEPRWWTEGRVSD